MFKKRKNQIRFYIQDGISSNVLIKPSPATKFLPEWYKKQPAVVDAYNDISIGRVASTVKKCMPVFDAMTAGYYLYAPCDIYINATDPDNLIKSIPQGMELRPERLFAMHTRSQYEYMAYDKEKYHGDVIRITPGWSVGTSEGYSALFTSPMNSDNSPLMMVPGIVDTDKFVSDGHFSFFVDKTFNGVIKRGTPLVQVIPFKRESWTSVFFDQDASDKKHKEQRGIIRSTFTNAYKTMFRSSKDYR